VDADVDGFGVAGKFPNQIRRVASRKLGPPMTKKRHLRQARVSPSGERPIMEQPDANTDLRRLLATQMFELVVRFVGWQRSIVDALFAWQLDVLEHWR
jgi:hypothetical protein